MVNDSKVAGSIIFVWIYKICFSWGWRNKVIYHTVYKKKKKKIKVLYYTKDYHFSQVKSFLNLDELEKF